MQPNKESNEPENSDYLAFLEKSKRNQELKKTKEHTKVVAFFIVLGVLSISVIFGLPISLAVIIAIGAFFWAAN